MSTASTSASLHEVTGPSGVCAQSNASYSGRNGPAASQRTSLGTAVPYRAAGARAPGARTGGHSGSGELALDGVQDAGAVLVRTLVGADLLGAILVVAIREHGLDLGDGQLVVAGPRLVAAQGVHALQHGRAVLVTALVGVDLGQVDLGERGQPARDLVGVERVIARDREVGLGRDGALDLALGLGDARHLARLAGGLLGDLADLADGIGGARLSHVVGRIVLDLGAGDGRGELRDLAQDAGEHPLLV